MGRFFCLLVMAALLAPISAHAADDLAPLGDEFNHGPTITNWQRLYQTEGWGNNALQQFDVNTTRPGRMFMRPYSSVWYAEHRGELAFKEVTGDFVITTDVEPTRQAGTGAPQSSFSLAGLMVRAPRTMTSPTQWTPGGQNYVFLSLGAASTPGTYQFEVKTTVNSVSTLDVSSGPPRALLQIARLGSHVITLRRNPGEPWAVHRRYARPDLPARLQAGLTVYTDWTLCDSVGFQNQNTRVLTNGAPLSGGGVVSGANPDLLAAFDYVRYQRPQIPANLTGANFSNPAAVSDAQLLSFLGVNANSAFAPPPRIATPNGTDRDRLPTGGFPVRVQAVAGLACTLQTATGLTNWSRVLDFAGTGTEIELVAPTAADDPFRFYRVIVNP